MQATPLSQTSLPFPFTLAGVGLAALLAPACVLGGDSGEEAEPGIVECAYKDEPLAWDAPTPEGVVAEDLLAFAEGSHDLVGGEIFHDGQSEITLAAERRGESAIYRENTEGGCGNYLEVPLTVTIATSLHDSPDTLEVDAIGRGEGDGTGALDVRGELDPAPVHTDLDEIVEEYGGDLPEGEREVVGLNIEATFSAEDSSGEVYIRVEVAEASGEDGAVSLSTMRLVFW